VKGWRDGRQEGAAGAGIPTPARNSRQPAQGGSVDRDRFDESAAWREATSGWTEDDPERLALRAETRAAIEAAMREPPEAQRRHHAPGGEGPETGESCDVPLLLLGALPHLLASHLGGVVLVAAAAVAVTRSPRVSSRP
jgi:hypothetical protein